MYSYRFDNKTHGYLLTTQTGKYVANEIRPVFVPELALTGLGQYFEYDPNETRPLMWGIKNSYLIADVDENGNAYGRKVAQLNKTQYGKPLDIQIFFDGMITSQIEHHAVLNVCLSIERLGIPVRRLPVNQEGIVESEAFQTSISDQTKLVSVMLANNEIGTVEPISALAEIAHQHGALFHTDAVQAVGHIPVDVKALGVDLLSASGHKFNGPKGVGFLYIKKGTEIQPYANGGGQESGIRAGTENIASIVAMACALRKNCDRMITVSERLSRMEHIFIHTLNQAGIDYIRNGADNHIPGNINISIRDANGESLLHRLDLKGICISTGSACDSVNTKVSHVIQAIGIPKEYAQGTIRISFGADNIETDASEVATALIEILRK